MVYYFPTPPHLEIYIIPITHNTVIIVTNITPAAADSTLLKPPSCQSSFHFNIPIITSLHNNAITKPKAAAIAVAMFIFISLNLLIFLFSSPIIF